MSFGNTLGRGIGKLGALTVEGAVRGASAAGQFGADVVEGAQQGYDEKHAALLISREQRKVEREAARREVRERGAVHDAGDAHLAHDRARAAHAAGPQRLRGAPLYLDLRALWPGRPGTEGTSIQHSPKLVDCFAV